VALGFIKAVQGSDGIYEKVMPAYGPAVPGKKAHRKILDFRPEQFDFSTSQSLSEAMK
jgi:hypothetical protein